MPYVDVRVSLNSFIPADLDDHMAEKLANFYLYKLENNPELHDKIEFELYVVATLLILKNVLLIFVTLALMKNL